MMLSAPRARLRLPCVASPFLRMEATKAQASRSSSQVLVCGEFSHLKGPALDRWSGWSSSFGDWSFAFIRSLDTFHGLIENYMLKIILKLAQDYWTPGHF